MTKLSNISASKFAAMPHETQTRVIEDAFGSSCDTYFTRPDTRCTSTARKIAKFMDRLPTATQSGILTGLSLETRCALFRMLISESGNEHIAAILLNLPETYVPVLLTDVHENSRGDVEHLMSAGGPMPKLEEMDFDRRVVEARRPVGVYIGATWCMPCKKMKPIAKEIAAQFDAQMGFFEMDWDKLSGEFKERFKLRGVPIVLFFKDGELKEATHYSDDSFESAQLPEETPKARDRNKKNLEGIVRKLIR